MPKVLIIEDEKMMNDLLKDTFEKNGFEAVSALTGKEGLQSAKITSPDAILLDIRLPDTSGFAIIRQLKKDPGTKEIPVVFMTNYKDETEILDREELKLVEKVIIKYESNPNQVVKAVEEMLSSMKQGE